MIFLFWRSRPYTPEEKARIMRSPWLRAIAGFRWLMYTIASAAFLLAVTICVVGTIGGMIYNALTGS